MGGRDVPSFPPHPRCWALLCITSYIAQLHLLLTHPPTHPPNHAPTQTVYPFSIHPPTHPPTFIPSTSTLLGAPMYRLM